ncbi:flavocytochrome c [Helcococcus kunzii]|uniref:flavocytochrome c n=1 Tax=Helcococcus kunzii TaxID=40091 RepID=UPI0038AF0557
MKKTKKIFSIFLALMMIFSLVSCSNNKETIKESNVETKNKSTKKESQKEESDDSEYISDVIVVGGGGAGLVSALSAAEKNAKVIVLEKQAAFGGATSMSSGKIPAVGTKEQKEANVDDSVEAMMRDINRAGEYTQNQELLRVACENATNVKEWLEEQGIKWKLETESIYYGQSENRIHVAEGSGSGLVNILEKKINNNENIIALKNMNVSGLLKENGKVTGVFVEKDGKTINFKADKIILATSGFGANKEMIKKYTPSIEKGVPNVAPGATGDGILWGIELGADTAAMNAYQGYAPISYKTHKSLGSAFLDNGGILINKEGNRFIGEYTGYSPLATAIVNQTDSSAFMIWDENIQNLNIKTLKALEEGELIEANTIEELANKLSVDVNNLKKEYENYLEGIKKGEDYLNRTKLPKSFEAPFYAVKVTGDYRHTQGGLVINPETSQVLDKGGKVIENLYAAGGVTEGFSSNGSNAYMAGNGLLQAFVYGNIAGYHSADNLASKVETNIFTGQRNDLLEISNTRNIKVSDQKYKDGTYKTTSKGHGGDIEVEVVIKEGKINDVKILNHSETEGISDPAIKEIPEIIVESNNAEVDSIGGATVTSNGIISAVKEALEKAK